MTIDDLAVLCDVTTRTIRRDLQALEESGFPLFDDKSHDDGRTRWSINGQAFKALGAGLTLSELCALYFSRTLLESLAGTPFRDDVERAFEKLASVLTPHMRQFLDQLPRVLATKSGPSRREAGAAAVHGRISSPPVKWPCFYGIDFASRAELVANGLSVDEICTSIGADSLGYVDLDELVLAQARQMARATDLEIDVSRVSGGQVVGIDTDLGRLLENLGANAVRHARDRVTVTLDEQGDRVLLVVDDDGPGLSPQQREQVARRGRRLDETKPGSGLGLSIVLELTGLYGGGLTLGTAPIGGLRAELVLPGA